MGCCSWNSRAENVSHSGPGSDKMSPCVRHLRNYVTSGCKLSCGGRLNIKLFWTFDSNDVYRYCCQCSLLASSDFTVLLSSTSVTSSFLSTICLIPCECSISQTSLHTHSTVGETTPGDITMVWADWFWKDSDQWGNRLTNQILPFTYLLTVKCVCRADPTAAIEPKSPGWEV